MKSRALVFSLSLLLLASACSTPAHTPNMRATQSSTANDYGLLEISADFKEGTVPRDLKETRQEYHGWKSIGIVVEDNTIIAVERGYTNYGEMEVENGIIIGRDDGEWGGGIEFKPRSGSAYTILGENLFGFYTIEEKKFVITERAYLGKYDHGRIYELILADNKWQAKKIFDIGGQPEAFLVVQDKLFIVTNDSLLLIKDGESKILIENAFWEPYFPFSQNGMHYMGPLAPRSMVYGNHTIYIGMYGGMYAYDLQTGMEKWYDYLPE